MQRGYRAKLDDHLDTGQPLQVRITTLGGAVYDTTCFGVDADEKLSDDRYMVFYNQLASPAGEITLTEKGNTAQFDVQLAKLPATINKLVFTVSIDGDGRMGQIQAHTVEIVQNGAPVLTIELTGKDFLNERAIISLEIYRKGVWRVNAVARGFNGGLSDLLANFGGEEADDSAPAPQPVPAPAPPQPAPAPEKTQLFGRIRMAFSEMGETLKGHAQVLSERITDIRKRTGAPLVNTQAKVVVALDYSSSMRPLYENGTVQKTLARLVPLGMSFDDNGRIEVFLFQNDFRRLPDLTPENYEHYVENTIASAGYRMGGTCYAPVLQAITEGTTVREHTDHGFGGTVTQVEPLVEPVTPTFVLFITDGENEDRTLSDRAIRRSAELNVFIQFVGIGDLLFSYLQEVDELPGRRCDNTGFSRMADLMAVNDKQFYDNILSQFACWLQGKQ